MTAPARISQADAKPFTVPSLASRWECSEGLVRKMIDRGELRSFRIGALIRIPADEVERIECQSSTVSSDSGEATHSYGGTPENDDAAGSTPKIDRARKLRPGAYGKPATIIHGRWADS